MHCAKNRRRSPRTESPPSPPTLRGKSPETQSPSPSTLQSSRPQARRVGRRTAGRLACLSSSLVETHLAPASSAAPSVLCVRREDTSAVAPPEVRCRAIVAHRHSYAVVALPRGDPTNTMGLTLVQCSFLIFCFQDARSSTYLLGQITRDLSVPRSARAGHHEVR
ncbi:hypothetical protein BD309DRAFT_973869, partial [Dichomitus squalens]